MAAWTKVLLLGDVEAIDPLALAGDVTIVGSGKSLELINLKAETPTTLTIATGSITAAQLYHSVATEAAAASDDLDNISGGADGRLLILRPSDDTKTVVVRHNQNPGVATNILMGNGNNYTMDGIGDMIMFMYDLSLNTLGAWVEIARNVGAPAVLSDTVPNTIEPDDTAIAGTASAASRQDHEHAIAAAVPVAVGTTLAEGTGTSFARADHVHELGTGSIDTANQFAAGIVDAAALGSNSVQASEIDETATDIAFAQIILTPAVAGVGTAEGTLMYDSDDNHLYVYVV